REDWLQNCQAKRPHRHEERRFRAGHPQSKSTKAPYHGLHNPSFRNHCRRIQGSPVGPWHTQNAMAELLHTAIKGLPAPRVGKVREVYDLGNELLIIATDRISAFDAVMANGIPDKGRILTTMST